MKVLLSVRAYYHSRNQKQFVEWNRKGLGDNSESAVSLFIGHVKKNYAQQRLNLSFVQLYV